MYVLFNNNLFGVVLICQEIDNNKFGTLNIIWLASDCITALGEVMVMGGGKGEESVVRGYGSGVIWERGEGGGEEYSSGSWEGFSMIALSASWWISPRRMLLRRFLVSAKMSS